MMVRINHKGAAVAVLFGLLPVGLLGTECGTLMNDSRFPIENSTKLRIVNQAQTIFSDNQLQNAVSKWSGCGGFGTDFPSLQVGGSGGKPIFIKFVPSENPNNDGACEKIDISISGHTLNDATITLYLRQNNGASCAPVDEDIGHALGHVLGLDDNRSAACKNSLMGIRQTNRNRAPADDSECRAADFGHKVFNEPPEGDGTIERPCETSAICA